MWVPNVYEGLVSGMLKGMGIGLLSVLLLWAAAELVEMAVRRMTHRPTRART